MLLALVAFGIWWLVSGGAGGAFAVALAILIGIAPVALAMSTSTALRIGILSAAERGLLIRDAEAFRSLASADSVMFNRVGTLTAGEMHVLQVAAVEDENPELILRVAGALMMESDHPVSAAIVRACRVSRDTDPGGDVPHWIDVHHVEIDDDGAFIGQAELPVVTSDGDVEKRFVEASLWRPRDMSALDERMAVAAMGGGTPLVISWRGKVRGVITVGEDIKPDAVEAIDELEEMGVDTIMITRDPYPVARRFADRLGISRVYAGIVPGRKAAAVRGVHSGGETVVMVGGSDVAECLRVADVGVMMDADAGVDDLEIEESDVVSLRSRSVPSPRRSRWRATSPGRCPATSPSPGATTSRCSCCRSGLLHADHLVLMVLAGCGSNGIAPPQPDQGPRRHPPPCPPHGPPGGGRNDGGAGPHRPRPLTAADTGGAGRRRFLMGCVTTPQRTSNQQTDNPRASSTAPAR